METHWFSLTIHDGVEFKVIREAYTQWYKDNKLPSIATLILNILQTTTRIQRPSITLETFLSCIQLNTSY